MRTKRRWWWWVVAATVLYGTCRHFGARGECDLAPQDWNAEAPYHDYLERVSFADEQHGRMVQGDHQVVRVDREFEYRLRDEEIEFRSGTDAWSVGYGVESGDFEVEEHPPSGPPEKVHYGCRLRFETSPFPPGSGMSRTDYYAVRR